MTETETIHAAVLEAIKLGISSVKGPAAATLTIAESTGLWASEDPDQPSLYFDSLDLLELVVFLEDEYGWVIPEEQIDAEGWRTVGDLASVLTEIASATGQGD
jgi:acyl carrier protein